MHVVLEHQVRTWDDALGSRGAPAAMSCLLDLDVSCNLRRCGHGSGAPGPLPRDVARLLSHDVVRRAAERGASRVDVAFFGGEPLLEPASLLELSADIARACERRHIEYAGHLITDGTLLASVGPRALAGAGLGRVQVTIEGGPRPGDEIGRMPRGASWDEISAALKRLAGAAELVIRSSASQGHDLEELLSALEDEGLLTAVAALLVARRAPYAEQARDLLRLFPLLHGAGGARPRVALH